MSVILYDPLLLYMEDLGTFSQNIIICQYYWYMILQRRWLNQNFLKNYLTFFQSSFRFTAKFWGRYRYFSFNSGSPQMHSLLLSMISLIKLWFFLLHLLKLMDLTIHYQKWNKNHNEILPHQHPKWLYQKYKFWRCWIKELCTVGGKSANRGCHYGKQYGKSSKN